ncbi:hypothetical protein H8356DRAFT_1327964 [Neocallimastix lanati (nom. inval.)]|nr:hypothetical protein H8356DRAFT_1327964 [Neocallimastix sp. JGI-2020a]
MTSSNNCKESQCRKTVKAVQQEQYHLSSRKLDKGSSNKALCVYGCAAEEKSYITFNFNLNICVEKQQHPLL